MRRLKLQDVHTVAPLWETCWVDVERGGNDAPSSTGAEHGQRRFGKGTLTTFPAGAYVRVFEGFELLVGVCHGAFCAIRFLDGRTTGASSGVQHLRSRFQLHQDLLLIVSLARHIASIKNAWCNTRAER